MGFLRKIIVVEDDALVRDMTVSALRRFDYEVIASFDNAAAAWAYLDGAEDLDIVVADVNMPGMDGLALLQKIKAKYPQKICICMSGDVSNKKRALQLGADAFLVKPFVMSDLYHVLQNLENECHAVEDGKRMAHA